MKGDHDDIVRPFRTFRRVVQMCARVCCKVQASDVVCLFCVCRLYEWFLVAMKMFQIERHHSAAFVQAGLEEKRCLLGRQALGLAARLGELKLDKHDVREVLF